MIYPWHFHHIIFKKKTKKNTHVKAVITHKRWKKRAYLKHTRGILSAKFNKKQHWGLHKYERPSACCHRTKPCLSRSCVWGGISPVLPLFSELFHFEKYSQLHYVIRSSHVGTSNRCASLPDASIYLALVDGRRRPVTKSQYLTRWAREQAGNTNKRHKHRRPDSWRNTH